MKLAATFKIPAARDRVYDTLTDPGALQQCIPGCEELSATGEHRYTARLKVGIAGLKGTFSGTAELADLKPPESYTLVVEGKGAPGFVRGRAHIALTDEQASTTVVCDAELHVGGVIAAVGSRILDVAARKTMGDFFECLSRRLEAPPS